MPEIHVLIRRPLSEGAQRVLGYLLARRRQGRLVPPIIRDAAEELETLAPAVRQAAEELHERRLAVLDEAGILAPIRWPLLTAIKGRGWSMSLAEQLAEVGAEVPGEIEAAWGEAEKTGEWPAAEATGDAPADQAWLALRAAQHGDATLALEACRRCAEATIATGVVLLMARLAGWMDRILTATGSPQAPAVRFELPMSDNERAQQAFVAGWQAELIRNRERAQAAYVEALRADPGFDRARLRYAQVTFDLGGADVALAELLRLTQARPRLGAAHLLRAELILELVEAGADLQRWNEQVELHIAAALGDANADHGRAWALRSRKLMAEGKGEEAAEAARRAIALQPGCAEYYHLLGSALAPAGDLVAAAWAEAAGVLADHEFTAAAQALFTLRQLPQVASAVPHGRQLIDETWQ
jgi:tetratricopeptide (TPR) repeat protein